MSSTHGKAVKGLNVSIYIYNVCKGRLGSGGGGGGKGLCKPKKTSNNLTKSL